MNRWIAKIAMVALVGPLVPTSLVGAKTASEKALSPAAWEWQKKLKKIESSIEVTKKRIENQKETTFSPDLFFMLAELYHDRSVAAVTLKKEKNPGVPEAELDFSIERRYLQDAIEMYKVIEDRYPEYPTLDRVVFSMGQEYKVLGDEKSALAAFKRTSDKFPSTSYGRRALLEIGDIFFQKKDYEYALGSYRKVIETKKSPEVWIAYQKAGMSLIQLDRWSDAVQSFEKIYTSPISDTDSATDIQREEALTASVWPLLELSPQEVLSQPKYQKPVRYYGEVAGDKARYRRVLARLAQRAQIKKRSADGIEASLELFRLADDVEEKRTAFESAYLLAKKEKNFSPSFWVLEEIKSLTLDLKRLSLNLDKRRSFEKYEVIFRDVLTTIQTQVVATKRAEDLVMLGDYYRDYLELYGRSRFASAMKLNRAEVLFQGGRYAEAGQLYSELAMVSGRKQKDLWLSSLESFLKVITSPNETLVDKVQSRSGYRQVAATYLKRYPQDPRRAGIEFNIARTYYDEQNFEQASKSLFSFLSRYPNQENSKTAALLYLDCFYLRAQLDQMAKAGSNLLKISGLSNETKSAVRDASNQAQMKALRSIAGELTSPSYAMKFREFARKNKNSQMGEQALYEAYTVSRSQNQAQSFEFGEEYVAAYGQTPRVREVLLTMSQSALLLSEYERGASYLGSLARLFPADPNAKSFAEQAALIYEHVGKPVEAQAAYMMAGQTASALRTLQRYGEWRRLNEVSARAQGLMGLYFQGLSLTRLGKKNEGRSLLERAAKSPAISPEEKEWVGHANILLAESELAQFRTLPNQAFSQSLLQQKSAQYQKLLGYFQNAVASGGGRWVVAGLYGQSVLNKGFADFFSKVSPPAGISPGVFRKTMAAQSEAYVKAAQEQRAQCVSVADTNDLPTNYASACLKGTLVAEAGEFADWRRRGGGRSPASIDARLVDQLKSNPRSASLLRQYATQKIQQGEPTMALLLLSRASEIDANDSQNESFSGVAHLHLNQFSEAQAAFQRALAKNQNDSLAKRGLFGIAKYFGLQSQIRKRQVNLGRAPAGSPTHPLLQ